MTTQPLTGNFYRNWQAGGFAASKASAFALLTRFYSTVTPFIKGWVGLELFAVVVLLAAGPTAALVTIVPFLFAVMFLVRRDAYMAILIYMAYSAIEGMYKYISSFSAIVYSIAPLMLILILVGWAMGNREKGAKVTMPPGGTSLVAFVVIAMVQAVNPASGGSPISGLATAFLWYVGPLSMYFVVYNVARTSKSVVQWFYLLIFASTIVSVVALLQLKEGEAWTKIHFPGVQLTMQAFGESYRPPSTTAMGGGSCTWSALAICMTLGLLTLPYISMPRKRWLVGLLIVNLVALIISGVRLSVLQVIFSVVLYLVLIAKTPQMAGRNVAIAAIAGALAVTIAGQLTGGAIADRYLETLQNPLERFSSERGQNLVGFGSFVMVHPLGMGYSRGLGSWQDRTASGVGNGFTATEDYASLRDTQFGALAQDVGLPGLIAAYFGIIAILVYGYRSFRTIKSQHIRYLGASLLSTMAGILPGSFAGTVLQNATWFWISAGLLVILPMAEKAELDAMRRAMGEEEGGTAAAAPAPAPRLLPSERRRREREALAAAQGEPGPRHGAV